jgi:hypothetical protein
LSVCVQAFPSLQIVPFGAGGLEHAPVVVLHVPAVWHASEAVHVTGLDPVQAPARQLSVCVQAFPSLQLVPSGAGALEQAPVVGLHVPAVWHSPAAGQVTGLDPLQVPAWQVSVCVHVFPSLQAVPLGATGLEHAPVAGSHVPAVWHSSEAVHVTGFDPAHVPFWQLSAWMQAFPSLQAVPLGCEPVKPCGGHWLAVPPTHLSSLSQGPVAGRQTVSGPDITWSGHSKLVPLQVSAGSHTPSEPRHTWPAGAGASVGHSLLIVPQNSGKSQLARSLGAGRHTSLVRLASPRQESLIPSQSSARSQTPATGRQTNEEGCLTSVGQLLLTPSHVSGTSQIPAELRQSVSDPLFWSITGQVRVTPSQVSGASQTPAAGRHTVVVDAGVV